MSDFIVFCQCGNRTPAPIHCRNCNAIDGARNCSCGRPLRGVHLHKCDRCRKTQELFRPETWQQHLDLVPGRACTTSTRTTATIEPPKPKPRPRYWVESWEYEDGKISKHKVYDTEET